MPRMQNLIGTERLPKMSIGKALTPFTTHPPGVANSRSLYLQLSTEVRHTGDILLSSPRPSSHNPQS